MYSPAFQEDDLNLSPGILTKKIPKGECHDLSLHELTDV